jgi:hypothetical protein
VSYHTKHLLDRCNREVYEEFIVKYPEHDPVGERLHPTVSLTKFKSLRPFYVRKLKWREICLATEDIACRHLLEDLTNRNTPLWLRKADAAGTSCECPDDALMCATNHPKYSAQLARRMICQPEDGEWPKWDCVHGLCLDCSLPMGYWSSHGNPNMSGLPSSHGPGGNCTLLWNDTPDARWREWQKVPHPKAVSDPEKFGNKKIMDVVKRTGAYDTMSSPFRYFICPKCPNAHRT